MLFNSWEFVVLVVVAFGLYHAPWSAGRHGKAWQVSLMLAASAVFYGWTDPRLLWLLGCSCAGNSVAVAGIIRQRIIGNDASVRVWVRVAVALNLALLAAFKYAGFVGGWLPGLPAPWVEWLRTIPLPIGISFYTFHGISMIVDVARGDVNREGDAITGHGNRLAAGTRDLGFYLLFFPQLVAGPIVKAKQFWPQIGAKRFGDIDWSLVIRSLVAGYFLKMVVADNLAEQTAVLAGDPQHLTAAGPLILLPLLYSYSIQIFADFGGYSLIAIGLAAMFGYRFPDNFRFPYLATSFTEFWRRWHMSLSAWLRDYLYIPLGGSRRGPFRNALNLFLVMFLGGLWHGAAWKFALWGSLHGLFLAAERWGRRGGSSKPATGAENNVRCVRRLAAGIGRWFATFNLVTVLWLAFLMPDLASIRAFAAGLAAPWHFSGPPVFALAFFGLPVAIYHWWGWLAERPQGPPRWLLSRQVEGCVHGLMLFLLATNSGAPRGFIYFQF